MKYEIAHDIQDKLNKIVLSLGFHHVKLSDVICIRSFGTKSKGTIARCHALNKVMQRALGRKGFYVLEFLSERFDNLSDEEKLKIIIHEMMHIPKSFGGGFKHHNYVTEGNINKLYKEYVKVNKFNNLGKDLNTFSSSN